MDEKQLERLNHRKRNVEMILLALMDAQKRTADSINHLAADTEPNTAERETALRARNASGQRIAETAIDRVHNEMEMLVEQAIQQSHQTNNGSADDKTAEYSVHWTEMNRSHIGETVELLVGSEVYIGELRDVAKEEESGELVYDILTSDDRVARVEYQEIDDGGVIE